MFQLRTARVRTIVKPNFNKVNYFSRFQNQRKNSEVHDPKIIDVTPDEYSKSGGDHVVGSQKSAYSSQHSHPHSAKEEAARESTAEGTTVKGEKESRHNPLEFSPANPELSDTNAERDFKPQSDLSKKSSVHGKPDKARTVSHEKKIQDISVKISDRDDERASHSHLKN
jgi:hypothetical protein